MKIVTVVGARPQFIKASPVSKAFDENGIKEIIIHTGQHYDDEMSAIFFRELNIKAPHINLNIGSGSHAYQTGNMMIQIEKVLLSQQPDLVFVYGDTNSTLAGALAACKLNIPVAHVEAGLRSFNRKMSEEHNRVLTDHCSDLLFCPTQTSIDNLKKEGIDNGVHLVGDTMYDAVLLFSKIAKNKSTILDELNIKSKQYLLATIRRPYNVDDPVILRNILTAFIDVDVKIILPIHPRTKRKIEDLDSNFIHTLNKSKVKIIAPIGYLDMLIIEKHSRVILTDSGGIQKEAYFFNIPCITLRNETEWSELVTGDYNILSGNDTNKILKSYEIMKNKDIVNDTKLYGSGDAYKKIVTILLG